MLTLYAGLGLGETTYTGSRNAHESLPPKEGPSIERLTEETETAPADVFMALTGYAPEQVELASQDSAKLARTLPRIAPYMDTFIDASDKTGIPDAYLKSTIVFESEGLANAVSYADAQGNSQIVPSTLTSFRSRVLYDIHKLNASLRPEELDSLLSMPLSAYLSSRHLIPGVEGDDWIYHRVPLALTVMRGYGGKVPYRRDAQTTLHNPRLSIHLQALIQLDHLLSLYATVVQESEASPGAAYADAPLSVPMLAASYNQGINYSRGLLGRAIGRGYDKERIFTYFDDASKRGAMGYANKVAQMTSYLGSKKNG